MADFDMCPFFIGAERRARTMMKKKILVVDDNEAVCESLDRLLSDKYEVFKAHTGKEALNRLPEVSPDLMILDVSMPDMDGLEVCRRIRKDPVYKWLPILMLTALVTEVDREMGLKAGTDDYMAKPFDIPELLNRLKALLK